MCTGYHGVEQIKGIHEVALRRLWVGLPMKLLQLAYSNYSEFLEVLVDQKKVALEFLVVPDLPQLPPFFLRSLHAVAISGHRKFSEMMLLWVQFFLFLFYLHLMNIGTTILIWKKQVDFH